MDAKLQSTSKSTWCEIEPSILRRVSFFISKHVLKNATPVTTTLCCLLIAAWAVEFLGWINVSAWAALKASSLRDGAVWQPLTYALCHGSWWHLAINLFALLITGHTLERAIGPWRMSALILLAIPAGAVGFLLSRLLDPRLAVETACVGASALSTACFGTIALLAPREKITLWLLIFPIPFRAGWLLPVIGLLLCAELIYAPGLTAYGAHLGGWLLGLAYARLHNP